MTHLREWAFTARTGDQDPEPALYTPTLRAGATGTINGGPLQGTAVDIGDDVETEVGEWNHKGWWVEGDVNQFIGSDPDLGSGALTFDGPPVPSAYGMHRVASFTQLDFDQLDWVDGKVMIHTGFAPAHDTGPTFVLWPFGDTSAETPLQAAAVAAGDEIVFHFRYRAAEYA